jgi:hypothetical protein
MLLLARPLNVVNRAAGAGADIIVRKILAKQKCFPHALRAVDRTPTDDGMLAAGLAAIRKKYLPVVRVMVESHQAPLPAPKLSIPVRRFFRHAACVVGSFKIFNLLKQLDNDWYVFEYQCLADALRRLLFAG